MNQNEQVQMFANDLDNLVERYRREFDINYAGVVGALHIKAHLMCAEAAEQKDEDY